MPPLHADVRSTLEEIIVYTTDVEVVPKDYLTNLPKLTRFRLSHSKLKQVPHLMPVAATLNTLILPDNQIQNIPAGTFDNMTQIATIYLEHNLLDDVSNITNITSLQTLYLSGNVGVLQYMASLRLVVATNPRLYKLYLEQIKFKTFPDLGYAENIKTVNLDDTELFYLGPEEHIINLPNLKFFYLKRNIIKNITNIAKVLPKLAGMDITGNKLTSLSGKELCELKYLRYLYMEDCDLTSLPRLADCNCGTIPLLAHLSFKDNQLTTFAFKDLRFLPNLRTLQLNNNLLQALPSLELQSSYLKIYMDGNPLSMSCDDKLCWTKPDSGLEVVVFNGQPCSQPLSLTSVQWSSVTT